MKQKRLMIRFFLSCEQAEDQLSFLARNGWWMNARAGDFSPVFFSRKRILYVKNINHEISHIYIRNQSKGVTKWV